MKLQNLLMSSFVIGMLIMGFAVAKEYGSGSGSAGVSAVQATTVTMPADSVTIDQAAVEAGFEDSDAVNQVYDEVDKESGKGKARGFTTAYVAQGWYVYSDSTSQYGKIVRLAWASKEFVSNSSSNSSSNSTNTKMFSRGLLQLGGSGGREVYKLVPSSEISRDTKQIDFVVYKGDKEVGKMNLVRTSSDGLKGLALWSGDLSFSTPNLISGKLTLASNSVAVRKGSESIEVPIMPNNQERKNTDGTEVEDDSATTDENARKNNVNTELRNNQVEDRPDGETSGWTKFWNRIFGNRD